MKKLCLHPAFIAGMAIRLALMVFMAPQAIADWYAPFLDATTATATLDPWTTWITAGGDAGAFPYGYAMWLLLLPLTLLAKAVGLPVACGYGLTLLVADFCLLLALRSLLPERQTPLLLKVYWLSPIVLLAGYALGLNDLIPAALLFFAIVRVRRHDARFAGLLCAVAVSAKLSMLIAAPFFAVYLYNNRALRHMVGVFVAWFCVGALVLIGPFLLSEGGRVMLFGNPEMGRIYELSIVLSRTATVYVAPLVYLVMLYLTWRVRRLNFDLFLATMGLAFLFIVLMTPASPGWFVWSLPFLVFYLATTDSRMAGMFIAAFSALYVLGSLFAMPLHFVGGGELNLVDLPFLPARAEGRAVALLHTTMVAVGLILGVKIWRESVVRNDFFRLSRKPFVIGVAGDSGAGKDMFAQALTGLFGAHSVAWLSGDDYHLWDRQKPMWRAMTHLNPMANDLERFSNDLVALKDGREVVAAHYDHDSGKMSRPAALASNDFVIASGLHALYMPIMRQCYDLKIYLDIDERLRRHFKLRRDVNERGHTFDAVMASFTQREADAAHFIRPQAAHADLVLSLQPINERMIDERFEARQLHLKLVARTRQGFNELSLNRVLIGVCGLHVDLDVSADDSQVEISIEGEVSAADVEQAARLLCPRVVEFLDIKPQWRDGMTGLMQLVTLSQINQSLTRRVI
jgi:uridine kinase